MKNSADINAALILSSKFKNAYRAGTPFDLSFQRVKEIFEKGTCEFTGIPFIFDHDQYKLTLERIDPRDGYYDHNVVGVTAEINTFKGETLDMFMHTDLLTTEQKIKVLGKLQYRLNKTLKEEQAAQKAEEEARLAEEDAMKVRAEQSAPLRDSLKKALSLGRSEVVASAARVSSK